MLRRLSYIAMLLVLLQLAGCSLTEANRSGNWLSRWSPAWAGGGGPNQIEVAVIEDALPSHYLSEALWQDVDEQVVPLELRPVLQANGLRLGVVHGACSLALHRLLTQPGGCPTAKRICTAADQEYRWPLREGLPNAVLEYGPQDATRRLELEQPEFGLALRLNPAERGRISVSFEPYVMLRSATRKLMTPEQKGGGWTLEPAPELRLAELQWKITLAANDYLVITGRIVDPNRFGALAFSDEGRNVQRALVIRGIGRQEPVCSTGKGPAPLALQAIGATSAGVASTPRGQAPD
jgi:hypothetical protein